jgi:hypothetical protein
MTTQVDLARDVESLRRELAAVKADIVPRPIRDPDPGFQQAQKWCVVRSVKDDEGHTDPDHMIRVQFLKEIDDSPYWEFESDTAVAIKCWPDCASDEWKPFRRASPAAYTEGMPTLLAYRSSKNWILSFELARGVLDEDDMPDGVPLTDMFPAPTG